MGEDKIQKRGLKRGHGEGGEMSLDAIKNFAKNYDQSVSVSNEEITSSINTLKWGKGRGQDQGGRVQGEKPYMGVEGELHLQKEKFRQKLFQN
jgi:hypothetical protein